MPYCHLHHPWKKKYNEFHCVKLKESRHLDHEFYHQLFPEIDKALISLWHYEIPELQDEKVREREREDIDPLPTFIWANKNRVSLILGAFNTLCINRGNPQARSLLFKFPLSTMPRATTINLSVFAQRYTQHIRYIYIAIKSTSHIGVTCTSLYKNWFYFTSLNTEFFLSIAS